ncbi:MAG TPA: glycosyltransferase family 4 protein [Candidatus Eisenbacteria bacterium]|nr:glycosyltransferase family 4 protein [Candidatus Eisenbacteria bacterium]
MADVRPRVLVIGPLPPPAGGVGMQVEAILRSPLAQRWKVDVFNTSKPGQEGKPSTVTLRDVIWAQLHLGLLPLRLLERPQVALVQATADTGYFRDLALLLECRLSGVPVVLHWHGTPDSEQFPGRSRWRRALFALGTKLSRRVIILSEAYRDFFAGFIPQGKLVVVPNFIDGSRFATPPRTTTEPVTVLFVGRVGPQKGVDVLLAALSRARAQGADVGAVLVGAAESPEAWAEVARHALVTSGVVRLTGALADERVQEYAAADVFCLPTRADSLPLALLEAMAAGLPSVCSSVGAIPWVLEDGRAGVLVPPGDVDALASALARLAGDATLRRDLGARARARQQAEFDAVSAAPRLEEALRWTRPASQGSVAPMSVPDPTTAKPLP